MLFVGSYSVFLFVLMTRSALPLKVTYAHKFIAFAHKFAIINNIYHSEEVLYGKYKHDY